MAISRPSGDAAAAIDVPSVLVRSICCVVGTSCAARGAGAASAGARRQSIGNREHARNYLAGRFLTVFGLDAAPPAPAFGRAFVPFVTSVSLSPAAPAFSFAA